MAKNSTTVTVAAIWSSRAKSTMTVEKYYDGMKWDIQFVFYITICVLHHNIPKEIESDKGGMKMKNIISTFCGF